MFLSVSLKSYPLLYICIYIYIIPVLKGLFSNTHATYYLSYNLHVNYLGEKNNTHKHTHTLLIYI
jgi:hypothetical protein